MYYMSHQLFLPIKCDRDILVKEKTMGKILNTSSLNAKYILPDMSERQVNINSNTTSTENMTTSFKKIKGSSQNFAVAGEGITITLTLTNDSEYELSEILIKDEVGLGATFKTGTLKIDGVQYPQFSAIDGFTLPDGIGSGITKVISYDVDVDTSPASDQLNFLSNITYTVDGKEKLTERSNILELQIETLGVKVEKSASRKAVVSGETISFVNVITNNGNVKLENVRFVDVLPSGVTFVPGSVTIDDMAEPDADPVTGIMLSDIDAGDEISISFDVVVSQ